MTPQVKLCKDAMAASRSEISAAAAHLQGHPWRSTLRLSRASATQRTTKKESPSPRLRNGARRAALFPL